MWSGVLFESEILATQSYTEINYLFLEGKSWRLFRRVWEMSSQLNFMVVGHWQSDSRSGLRPRKSQILHPEWKLIPRKNIYLSYTYEKLLLHSQAKWKIFDKAIYKLRGLLEIWKYKNLPTCIYKPQAFQYYKIVLYTEASNCIFRNEKAFKRNFIVYLKFHEAQGMTILVQLDRFYFICFVRSFWCNGSSAAEQNLE